MLLFSVFVFCASTALAMTYAVRYKKAGLFDPITIFLSFFALMVLPLPVRYLFTDVIEGDISPFLPNFANYMPWALLLCAASLPFFLWAYYSRLPVWIASRLPVPGNPKASRYFEPFFKFDRTRLAAILICAVSLGLVYQLAQSASVNGILGFLLLGYNSTAQMFGKGYLAAGIPWFFVGSLFFLYRYAFMRRMYRQYRVQCMANKRKPMRPKWMRVDLAIFAVLLIAQLLALFMLGDRHSILNYVILLVIFWHFAIRRLKVFRMAAIGVFGFVALNFIGSLRGSDYSSLDSFVSSTSTLVNKRPDNPFYTVTNGEFMVTFETLPQVIRKVPSKEIPARFGLTYLMAPLFFVPQAIYPSRPPTLTHWYMLNFYGSAWGQNEGRQFFFLSEGYLNFGPVGIFLLMVFWGFGLGALHQYRVLNRGNLGAVFLYAICAAFIFRAMVGDSVSLLVGLPEQFLAIAVVGFAISGGFKYNLAPGTKLRPVTYRGSRDLTIGFSSSSIENSRRTNPICGSAHNSTDAGLPGTTL
jgi:hypothetical protein